MIFNDYTRNNVQQQKLNLGEKKCVKNEKKRCCHGVTQKRHGKKVGWIKCIFLLNGSTLLDTTASGIHKEYMDYIECVFKQKKNFFW